MKEYRKLLETFKFEKALDGKDNETWFRVTIGKLGVAILLSKKYDEWSAQDSELFDTVSNHDGELKEYLEDRFRVVG